jgi:hypothetical protein
MMFKAVRLGSQYGKNVDGCLSLSVITLFINNAAINDIGLILHR